MRIISGIYGRRRFEVPKTFKARPTTDFAKENLFNTLRGIIDFEGVEALDLFSGTGSIAFEVLSRGGKHVTAIEADRYHAAFILDVAKRLNTNDLTVIRGDVFRFLSTAVGGAYDFIFADPPYDLPTLPDVPHIVIEKKLLRSGGVFVMEHSGEHDFSTLPFYTQKRVYGAVNFSIFANC